MIKLPNPSEKMMASPEFCAVWECIKGWDIEVEPDGGYCTATGSHVCMILDALAALQDSQEGGG